MERDKAIQANELIKEIDELKAYKRNKHDGNHFEFVEHYGSETNKIIIHKRHFSKFIDILDNIINELEQELLDL